jgi:hypothetical protein
MLCRSRVAYKGERGPEEGAGPWVPRGCVSDSKGTADKEKEPG